MMQFYVHQDLLDAHGFDISDTNPDGPDEVDKNGRNIWLCDMHPCVLRGFLHWLYVQELPAEHMIKSSERPHTWDADAEERPLACTMAVALYLFSFILGMAPLRRAATAYLFDYYRTERKVPDRS
ncbi:hypothetical protein IQ06DRAFT_54459 [Phaeosphaeriaceae sp. SRC1lsM3a]|nr:hypothetical protein IQ06DRAFT_54459 [Stagonospora sp. SRC1lsM3a]